MIKIRKSRNNAVTLLLLLFYTILATAKKQMGLVTLPLGEKLSDAIVIKDACEDAFGSDKPSIELCKSQLSLVEIVDKKLGSICHKTPSKIYLL